VFSAPALQTDTDPTFAEAGKPSSDVSSCCISLCVCVCVRVCVRTRAYVEEAHLSGLLGGVRTDQLDELLERLLRVIPNGRVGEVGAWLLQDGGGGEVEAGGGGVGARCGLRGGRGERGEIIRRVRRVWYRVV